MALTTIPVRTVKMKEIYKKEFETESIDDGYGYEAVHIEDHESTLIVSNYTDVNGELFLVAGKKYKVTLKIEEVE